MHKDLKGIVNKKDASYIFNTKIKDKTDNEKFTKQRTEYGFDEREIWSLDFTTATWIYSHLKRLKEWGHSDLYSNLASQYNVDIIKKDNNEKYLYRIINENIVQTNPTDNSKKNIKIERVEFIYEEKQMPYGEIIDIILEYTKNFLIYSKEKNVREAEVERYNLHYALIREALRLYGEIMPSLWD